MFSTDHPYGSMTQARAFLDQLPVSPADRERIVWSTTAAAGRGYRDRSHCAGGR